MKLGTMLVLGALVFGGLYVGRHVDDWKHRLHQEKAHLTAELKNRLESEKEHVTAALRERLAKARARSAVALRTRLARERARAEAARRRAATRKAAGLEAVHDSAASMEDAATGMTEAAFWRLISETRSAADNDTGKQSELLKEGLTNLSPQAIVRFARIRQRMDERAFTWDIWGAASVIEDGCSDDCFRDFRGYVISLGQGAYENALANPDSLASVVQDAESGDWENADDVAPDAYAGVTGGGDFPLADSDPSGQPRGTPFDENNTASLALRYPRLAARFR
jgi:hypothetical protein